MDEDGIAYLINQADDPPITAWDVRADTLEPTDLTYDPALPPSDQYAFSWNRNLGFEAAQADPHPCRSQSRSCRVAASTWRVRSFTARVAVAACSARRPL